MTQNWILFFMIVIPGLLSLALVDLVYRLNNRTLSKQAYKKMNLQTFKILPEKGLAAQGLLWLSIVVPISYFLTFGVVAWLDYYVQLSADGFETFVKISALPLGLLSFSVPLSLLIIRIHSTSQTAKQIEITKHKNNLDTYYAHRKAMFEYFAIIKPIKYEGDITGEFYLHPRLHLKFFRKTPPEKGVPNVNIHQIKKMLILLQRTRIHIQALIEGQNSQDIKKTHYIAACLTLYEIANLLALEQIYKTLKKNSINVEITENGQRVAYANRKYIYTIGKSQDELIGAFRFCRSYARLICEFCGYSTTSFSQSEYADIDRGEWDNTNKYRSFNYTISLFSKTGSDTIEVKQLTQVKPNSARLI